MWATTSCHADHASSGTMAHIFKPAATALFAVAVYAVSSIGLDAHAFQPSGHPVADRYLAMLDEGRGVVQSYGNVREDNGAVTITSLKLANGERFDDLTIGKLTLFSADVAEDQSHRLQSLAMENVSSTHGRYHSRLGHLIATEVKIPPQGHPLNFLHFASGTPVSFDEIELVDLNVTQGDQTLVSLDRFYSLNEAFYRSLPTRITFEVSGLSAPKLFQDLREQRPMLSALGMDQLTMSMNGHMSWAPETSRLELQETNIRLFNIGDLSGNFALTGIKTDLLNAFLNDPKSYYKLQPHLQRVALERATVRFRDGGLVSRSVDSQAAFENISRSKFIEKFIATLPKLAPPLSGTPFLTSTGGELETFLHQPEWIEINIVPPQPATTSAILGLALLDLRRLPEALNVSVKAVSEK